MSKRWNGKQCRPWSDCWSGSALFAQTYLSENLGSLWYSISARHLIPSPIKDDSTSFNTMESQEESTNGLSHGCAADNSESSLMVHGMKMKQCLFYIDIIVYKNGLARCGENLHKPMTLNYSLFAWNYFLFQGFSYLLEPGAFDFGKISV